MRSPIVTKRSTANANREKASRQQCRTGISTSPTPCCESLRQQHPNNSKQHGALAKTGDMQGGPQRPLGVQIYIPFQPQKWASNKSNSSVTSSCASCGFLRSRLESHSWNSFKPYPIANRVLAGVPTPSDSGKTPQLKTSKLVKNCGKTEFCISNLLAESAGVMKSKLFPNVNKGFIRFEITDVELTS